jgi:hypothetical protein
LSLSDEKFFWQQSLEDWMKLESQFITQSTKLQANWFKVKIGLPSSNQGMGPAQGRLSS